MAGLILPVRSILDLVRAVVRRVPFTISIVLAILAITTATRTLLHPISPELLRSWGFSLDDLRHGRIDLLILAAFQISRPYMALTIVASTLMFLGGCEYVLGTRRTFIAFWITHVSGYVLTYVLLWPLARGASTWAQHLLHEPDVGASAAGFGVMGTVVPFLPGAYRKPMFMALCLYLIGFVALDPRIWNLEHLIAFPTGLLVGWVDLRQRGVPWPDLITRPRFGHRQRPALVGWMVGVMGVVNILSAFIAPQYRGLAWLENALPLGPARHASHHLTLVIGFALLLLAFGLARAKHQAWLLTVIALAASVGLHVAKGADLPEALFAALLLLLVVLWRREFVARSDPPTLRQGYAALGLAAVAVPLYGLGGFFVLRDQYTEAYSVAGALRETGARLLFSASGDYAPATRRARWFFDTIPLLGWSGFLYALSLVLRGALAPARTRTDEEQARLLLRRFGRSGTSYMTLWEGNALFFGPQRRSYIGYRVEGGIAVALGDPIGPEDQVEPAVEAFERFCRESGWEPVYYAATPQGLPLYERRGYRTLKIAEEAHVPLAGLEFKGSDWQSVRTAIHRARRDGLRFELYDGGSVPEPVRAQLFEISAAWLAGQALPPMGFTLGKTTDVDDPNVAVAVALDGTGRVLGFLDWLPMYAAKGWVIDLMRRRADAWNGVMEFLIGSSLLAFKARGDRVVSLAAAPLANLSREAEESQLQKVLGFVSERFDTFYHFQSLFAFKKKFQPRWEGVYLVYRNPIELPRIALAILRAHVPEIGPRWIAELIRPASGS